MSIIRGLSEPRLDIALKKLEALKDTSLRESRHPSQGDEVLLGAHFYSFRLGVIRECSIHCDRRDRTNTVFGAGDTVLR